MVRSSLLALLLVLPALAAALPSPLLPRPALGSPQPAMGHRRWAPRPPHPGPAARRSCEDQTADWQEWEAGLTSTIKVKRERSTWDLRLVFSRPVTLDVYNGVADSISGSHFRVTPPPWGLARSTPGQQDSVSIKASFPPSGPRPVLEGIVINGKYRRCSGVQATTTRSPSLVYHGIEDGHTHHGNHIHASNDHIHDADHDHGHVDGHPHAPGDDHTHAPGVAPHDHSHDNHVFEDGHTHHGDHTHAANDHSHDADHDHGHAEDHTHAPGGAPHDHNHDHHQAHTYHGAEDGHTHHGNHIHASNDHSHDAEHDHGHVDGHTHAPGDDHTHAPGVAPHDHSHDNHVFEDGHTHHGDHIHAANDHSHDADHDHGHAEDHTHAPGGAPHDHSHDHHHDHASHATTKIQVEKIHLSMPEKVLGLYILLADDDEDGFDSSADWPPQLFPWQQQAANVLFFTFIHPGTMAVPPSFQKLAASRGSGAEGAVPADTVIMFAIGGYSYSLDPNPWHWLTSRAAAEQMAVEVAAWPEKYGCDGIDLDLEEGAGAKRDAGANMVHFIRKVKELAPGMIVSQPTYGYPQVQAEIDVINASWDSKGNHAGLADTLGLMVYEGTQALNYVKNYADGSGQWQGFPITASAPTTAILLGAKGASSSATITSLAQAAVEKNLRGIMVWYASVKNGFDYTPFWDASTHEDSIAGYLSARRILDSGSKSVPRSGIDWSAYILAQ